MSRRIERSRQRREQKEEQNEGEEQSSSAFATIPPASKYSLYPSDLLKLFTDSFKDLFEREDLEQLIQVVKGDLYNREYIKAFSDDERRLAYSVRWTPSRALAYSSLFSSLPQVRKIIQSQDPHVLTIGGGAGAEVVALCSLFTQYKADNLNKDNAKLVIEVVDIADWSHNIKLITNKVKESWIYSDPDSLIVNFKNEDIMKEHSANLQSLNLITLMFTTNELFQENRALASKFLQSLSNCKPGCLLLITESAGSFSHITIGTKRFPVQFLIDLILVGKNDTGEWELIEQTDSCWYRCASDFKYPLKLENMRFFFRLYRKK